MLRFAWAGLALAALVAAYWLLKPRFQRTQEEIAARRLMNPARLTAAPAFVLGPVFSPDGLRLAYASDAGSGMLSIWIHPLAGGQPVRLTDGLTHASDPDFSPDGQWIVYRSDQGGSLVVASLDGRQSRRIAANGRRPRFSPDGKWIAYYEVVGAGQGRLFLIPSRGGDPKPLQPDFPLAQAPIWVSPSQILFDGANAQHEGDWWIASLDGGAPIQTHATAR
ncbi:MAG: PD40 domain-containing protein, partial [Candidatus Solibacter usitatus]|nr:PD40 domain-containing protein [Candidatus Solibacter usitatus]